MITYTRVISSQFEMITYTRVISSRFEMITYTRVISNISLDALVLYMLNVKLCFVKRVQNYMIHHIQVPYVIHRIHGDGHTQKKSVKSLIHRVNQSLL